MLRTTMLIAAAAGAIAVAGTTFAQDGDGGRGQGPQGSMMGQNMTPGQMQRMMEMMGRQGRMGPGMMEERGMGPGMMQQRGMGRGMMDRGPGSGAMMRVIFALVDADGDGGLSLDEIQDAHARIFNHADTDGDGQLTMEEMRAFHRSAPAPTDNAD